MAKKRGHGDGALYYSANRGLWRAVVDLGRDDQGKRVQKEITSKDRKTVLAKLKKLIEAVEENGGDVPEQAPLLSVWAEKWFTARAAHTVDPKTLATYRSLSKRWIVPTLGKKSVDKIRASDVAALRTAIVDKAGRSTSTARQAQVVLSLMLDAAKADRYIRHDNPAKLVRKPKGTQVERAAIPTPDAINLLKVAADMPHTAGSRWWVKLLLGLRQTEILGATLADLDLEAGIYTVNWKLEELKRAHGCGGTCDKKRGANCPEATWVVPDDFEMKHLQDRWHLTRPKSRTGRIVPLVPVLVEVLKRHIEAHKNEPNPHGLIWRKPDGSPIEPKEDAADWRDLLQAAGLITEDENKPGGTAMTGHWARHTTVTVLAEMGVDFQIIGEIVGHSSAQVTAIYRHAQDKEKRATMELVANAWKLAIEA